MRHVDYTRLSLTEVRSQLAVLASEAQDAFGMFDSQQLNWRPHETRWSVGQCFAHLLQANQLMFKAIDSALDPAHRQTIWHRMPIVPGLCGRLMIRSQAPDARRKYSAPRAAQPATSAIAPDVIERFVAQHHDAARRLEPLDERRASATVMTSPFVRIVVYSVLDGWRLVIAHDWRHVEQARHVTLTSSFPTG